MSERQAIAVKTSTATPLLSLPVSSSVLQRKCDCGRIPGPTGMCQACQRQSSGTLQTQPLIQRQVASEVGGSNVPSIVSDVLHTPGQPLAPSTRAFMETRMGHDFSQVRVHTDSRAAAAAHAVNALAYTVGHDVVFNTGQYAPHTSMGQRVLAHELTHVVQQSQGPQTRLLQRLDWGPLGGKCCNESPEGDEWGLVGDGTWTRLNEGDCTGFWTDCDGMTCGGGFYKVGGLEGGICRTPRHDDDTYRPRRWTPNNPDLPSEAVSPTQRGSQEGDVPPDYTYDEK